jgi:hypothetical protein
MKIKYLIKKERAPNVITNIRVMVFSFLHDFPPWLTVSTCDYS